MGAIRVVVASLLGLAAAAQHSCGSAEGPAGAEPQDCDALDLMQRTGPARSELVSEALLGVSDITPFERDYLQGGWAQQIYGSAAERSEAPAVLQIGRNGTAGLKHRLVLHHIWKVGGTHLCNLAHESGLRAALNPGCHRLVNSSVPDAVKTSWRACAVQPGLAEIPFDVVGHECPVDEQTISMAGDAGFQWVGMIRDPVQQAYSWFHHAKGPGEFRRTEETMTEWLRACGGPGSTCGFFTFIPNLQTRWLAGGQCMSQPEQEGCVEQALANLKRMAVVLEQDGSRVKGTEKLQKLGWTVHEKEQDAGYVSGAATLLGKAAAVEIAHVAELQHLDMRLLKEARAQGLI